MLLTCQLPDRFSTLFYSALWEAVRDQAIQIHLPPGSLVDSANEFTIWTLEAGREREYLTYFYCLLMRYHNPESSSLPFWLQLFWGGHSLSSLVPLGLGCQNLAGVAGSFPGASISIIGSLNSAYIAVNDPLL